MPIQAREKYRKPLTAALLVVVAVVMGKALFTGLEIDEEYALSLGWRLVQGDSLFYSMWEPHQLAGLATAPLLWLWRLVTGGTTGVLLFVRSVALALKAALAAWFYVGFRRKIGYWSSLLAALTLFVYTPKWFLAPDYVSQQLHFTIAAFLCLYHYYAPGGRQYRRPWLVMLGAVLACWSFLAYPQSIVAVLPLAAGLWRLGAKGGEKRVGVLPRGVLIFTATCAVCGVLFLAALLRTMGLPLLLERAGLILSDPQYSFTTAERLANLARQAGQVGKTCLPPLLVGIGLCCLPKAPKTAPGRAWLVAALVGGWSALLTVWHTDLDVRIFCLAATAAGGVSFFCHRKQETDAPERALLFWLGWLPGVVAYLFILRSTLIALPTTFMYLLWPGVCGAVAAALPGKTTAADHQPCERSMAGALLLTALCATLAGRAALLQTTGWNAERMWEVNLQQITTGPAKGIWADEKAANMQEALQQALAPYPGGKVLQAIGEVHGLGFLMADGSLSVAQASVISGTDSDPRFIQYYAELPEKTPTVIVYDLDEVRDMQAFHNWIETQSGFAMAAPYLVTHGTAALEVRKVQEPTLR